MKTKIPLEQLLQWRLAQAEAEAPPAPSAARLLELARPWWETWPEHFRSLVERLSAIQVQYGHAMAETRPSRAGHLIPTLLLQAGEETTTFARILYLEIRGSRLRLRFQLDPPPEDLGQSLEVVFICNASQQPVLAGTATLAVDHEFRVDAELTTELARAWETLKVTDRMPFRLMLRTSPA
jgi:hypothetical protein